MYSARYVTCKKSPAPVEVSDGELLQRGVHFHRDPITSFMAPCVGSLLGAL
jgi:hypothetical protein